MQEKEVGSKIDRVAGASAGSLVAAVVVLAPEKLDSAIETLYSMADQVHAQPFGAMTSGYYLNDQLVKIIDEFLPKRIDNAQGKLHISVTKRRKWENVLINKFENRDHLISCLLASCYIPMYSTGYRGVPPKINEEECIDGGITNNLPIFPDVPTITCSPFSSQADICPYDPSTWNVMLGKQSFKASGQNLFRGIRALFPPNRHILKEYYDMGYNDADLFIRKEK
uniref:PNPLA domain-containing protein n=1 Tax=Caenorhabditis tropicalis TaxID=1561998 RepID=A0A1I7U769_9PELO